MDHKSYRKFNFKNNLCVNRNTDFKIFAQICNQCNFQSVKLQKNIKMDPIFIPIISVLGGSIALITYIYIAFRSRHIERMALIEHDKDASIFRVTSEEIRKSSRFSGLKWGLLLAGLGFGLIIGNILDEVFTREPVGVFSCMMIFGGLALISFHVFTNKIDRE